MGRFQLRSNVRCDDNCRGGVHCDVSRCETAYWVNDQCSGGGGEMGSHGRGTARETGRRTEETGAEMRTIFHWGPPFIFAGKGYYHGSKNIARCNHQQIIS